VTHQVDQESGGHSSGSVAARLALAKDDIGQQLPQLWSPIRQRYEQVQQRRLTVPVPNPFTEAKDLVEPRVEQAVVRVDPRLVDTAFVRAEDVLGRHQPR